MGCPWVVRGAPMGRSWVAYGSSVGRARVLCPTGCPWKFIKNTNNVGHGLGWGQGWAEADGARTGVQAETRTVACTGGGEEAGVMGRAWIRART